MDTASAEKSGLRQTALYLCMGAIDGDPPRPAGYHIYVGSKAAWHEITDDLKQYDTEPSVWP